MIRRVMPLLVLAILCTGARADPLTEFEQRRQTLLNTKASSTRHDPYTELARLANGVTPDEAGFTSVFPRMSPLHGADCGDFNLPPILWLPYKYKDNPGVTSSLVASARRTLLDFHFWPDGAGVVGTDSRCMWTENHYIMLSAGAYLAGQLYPTEVFTDSGKTGAEMMAINRPRIMRWLDLRFRSGFSEWLSNVYYNVDLPPLLSLVELCDDQEIATRAAMVTDMLLLDIALNSFRGAFGSTHGRSYEQHKKSAYNESTRDTAWLLFGVADGRAHAGNMGAMCLALSEKYRVPLVLHAIANDVDRPSLLSRQRMGLRLEEAAQWGLGFDNLEDGMIWLTLEAYGHPLTINLFKSMLDQYHWWQNSFFALIASRKAVVEQLCAGGQLADFARIHQRDLCRNLRDEVNIYTYRTPDYMLSSAPNYRAGYGGDQQHIWQATLGPTAVCFTTHPARETGDTPNYWAGSGVLPRVAQQENVCIIVYNAAELAPALLVPVTLDFTHAWLPRDQFDQFIELNGWCFARKGDGYLAFRSQNPYSWHDQDREMIVPGRQNVYVCELGRRSVDGEFAAFVQKVGNAAIEFSALGVADGRDGVEWSCDLGVAWVRWISANAWAPLVHTSQVRGA